MQLCKHLKHIGKSFSGNELYECEDKNIRFLLGASICVECNNFDPDLSQIPMNFLSMNWYGAIESHVYSCHWRIIASNDIVINKDVERIKNWTDRKVTSSGNINFIKTRKNVYDLEISGKGGDNRCRWCSSFRTALKTANLVKQRSNCGVEWHKLKDLASKELIYLDEDFLDEEFGEYSQYLENGVPEGFEVFTDPQDDESIYDYLSS